MREGDVVIAFAVFQLAIQHLFGDRDQVDAAHIVRMTAVRDAFARGHELCALRLRLGHIAERGMGDGLGVAHHRRRVAVERLILRQRRSDDVPPAAEPDLHMGDG